MGKINCNVFQDILPLYIDGTACDDTKRLVEDHLRQCESCRKLYDEICADLLLPVDTETGKSDMEEIRRFKKFLSKRHLRTIFLSIAAAAAVIVGVIVFMNSYMRRIAYQEAALTFLSEDAGEVRFTDEIKGNYRWRNALDRDTGVMTIYYEQSLWDRYIDWNFFCFDHIHSFLKKDMIKVVYIDPDGTEINVWEASEQERENYFRQERGPLG